MKVQCERCNVRFDDQFRTTVCPHDCFLANDGKNNFHVHTEAFIDDGRCPCGFTKADCSVNDGCQF